MSAFGHHEETQRKLEALDAIASELQDTCHKQAQRIAELEKILPELRRDSARYIWLISQESWEPPRDALPKWYGGKIKWLGGDYSIDEINEIIDAARGES